MALKDSLAALDAALAKRHRAAGAEVNEPAVVGDLTEIAACLGTELPEELVAWFGWHDGQDGTTPIKPEENQTLITASEAARKMEFWTEEVDAKPWPRSWVPLLTNGAGDFLVYETAGEHAGRLIRFWHDEADYWSKPRDRWHEAASLAEWVDGAVAAIEAAPPTKGKKPRKKKAAKKTEAKTPPRDWVATGPPTDESLAADPVGVAYFLQQRNNVQKSMNCVLFVKTSEDEWRFHCKKQFDVDATAAGMLTRKKGVVSGPQAIVPYLKEPLRDDYEGEEPLGLFRSVLPSQ